MSEAVETERRRAQMREACRRWRERHPERHRAATRAWQQRHPERHAAHQRVQRALASGRLERPEACEACGSEGEVHGHHQDYGKPLEVDWLCPPCHRAADLERES